MLMLAPFLAPVIFYLTPAPPILSQQNDVIPPPAIYSSSNHLAAASALSSSSSPSSLTTSSPTEGYLPRKLYPGTYQNYCGPTPEVKLTGGCVAHGWHGDDPVDRVDAACRLHDISYCQCESQLLTRQRQGAPVTEDIPMLASATALRFLTKPALEQTMKADTEYFKCINQADRQLIATGISVRGEMQRTGCSTDPTLSWFCNPGKGTLNVFEKVSLSIFLRDLDYDGNTNSGGISYSIDRRRPTTLTALEQQRQRDLGMELQKGKSIADAASSTTVQDDETQLLRALTSGEMPKVDFVVAASDATTMTTASSGP